MEISKTTHKSQKIFRPFRHLTFNKLSSLRYIYFKKPARFPHVENFPRISFALHWIETSGSHRKPYTTYPAAKMFLCCSSEHSDPKTPNSRKICWECKKKKDFSYFFMISDLWINLERQKKKREWTHMMRGYAMLLSHHWTFGWPVLNVSKHACSTGQELFSLLLFRKF